MDFVLRFLHTAWLLFSHLWYWAIVGTFLAKAVTRFVPFERIQATANGGSVRSVAIATLAGTALPLCACGVIPFLVSFLRSGTPLAVIMAFTAASPLMDPADFMVTAGVLGLTWAVVKTLAALAMGALVGLTVLYQNQRGAWLNQVKVRVVDNGSPTASVTAQRTSWSLQLVRFLADLWFSGKFLLLAILIGALLNTLVPATVVSHVLGGRHWYGIPLGSLLGIATYGISDAPIIKVLLGLGMSKGAGMSFLMAGHATSIGLLTTLYTLVRRPLFFFYLAATLFVSLSFGIIFEVI